MILKLILALLFIQWLNKSNNLNPANILQHSLVNNQRLKRKKYTGENTVNKMKSMTIFSKKYVKNAC